MGLLKNLGGAVASGLMGNLSEVSPEALTQEYGMYLMDGETITTGFKLVRDVVIVTDKRIIDFDKQGATGAKMRVDSINLSQIYHVSAETAGLFCFGDEGNWERASFLFGLKANIRSANPGSRSSATKTTNSTAAKIVNTGQSAF